MNQLSSNFFKHCSIMGFALFLLAGAATAKPLIPLEVHTKIHDLNRVREAIRGGFEDIVGSPALQNQGAYMQIQLVPNGFITLEEHLCDIHLVETVDGLKIIAIPYDEVGGQKREVTDFTVRKGVYMMIEGAAEELNFEAEARQLIPPNIGGFVNFGIEMKRLAEILKNGQPPVIDHANYPQQGRVFRLVTPNSSGMVQLEEDPTRPDHTLRMWVIQDLPSTATSNVQADAKVLGQWIDAIRSKVLKGDAPRSLSKDFYEKSSEQFSAAGFDVSLSEQGITGGTKKIILIQDSPAVKSSKAAY